jgi:hypothetical protein
MKQSIFLLDFDTFAILRKNLITTKDADTFLDRALSISAIREVLITTQDLPSFLCLLVRILHLDVSVDTSFMNDEDEDDLLDGDAAVLIGMVFVAVVVVVDEERSDMEESERSVVVSKELSFSSSDSDRQDCILLDMY